LPFIDVELEGDWQDSPIFRSLGLEIRTLAKDTLIYSNTHPINLLPGEEHLVGDTITDSLSAGDYAILGDLYTNIGQSVNSDIDYFTVIGDEVSLLMHPDTNDVPVGWTFQPNIQVINPLPDSQGGLHLIVRTEDSVYLDTTFTMDSSSVDTFPVSVSPLVPVILSGELTIPANDTLNKDITLNVIGGVVTLDVSAVDIAGLESFVLQSELENHSAIPQPVILERRWSSDSLIDTVLVSEGETVLLLDSLSITQSETLNVVATGSFGEEEKNLLVEFGIRGDITLDSLYRVAPDSIEMTGIIRNDGVYPVNLVALFCLVEDTVGRGDLPLQMEKAVWFPYDQSAKLVEAIHELPLLQESRDWEVPPTRIRGPDPYSKSARQERTRYILSLQRLRDIKRVGKDLSFEEFIDEIVRADIDTSLSYLYLSPGETDTIPIMFDFNDPGNYTIIGYLFTETLSVFLDSSSSSVNVIENSLVSIDSMLLSPYCDSTGSVPFSVLLSNQSYNSFNGSLTLVSPVCYLDTIVNIPSQSQDTIIFYLEDPVDEGEYIFTASLKEGGFILSEKQREFNFRPIYQFDSLPDELNAAVGDTGDISLSVSNIGNGRGERTISAQWVDVINLSLNAIIEPYSDSVFTQGFVVPLDLPGGKYYCDVRILNGAYPEVDTFIPIHIEGVYLTAEDSLDKLVYKIGDTVDFSILIENKGMWSGSLDATIQYGDFSLDTSFILGGMERGVCNDSFPRDTLYLDTFGVYLFDPINTTSYDSLQIQWSASTDSLEFSLRTDSTVGGGNWIVSDTGVVYPVEQWTQVRIINESVDTVWVDSIVLFFYPQDTLILDT
ncbi:hypothetical protein KAW48_00705, partial [candidate division WOR-3 bacterium]|nr:hypothetical protein [candidate division WOR-3 bacterium]